jgi:hypothetical protein
MAAQVDVMDRHHSNVVNNKISNLPKGLLTSHLPKFPDMSLFA